MAAAAEEGLSKKKKKKKKDKDKARAEAPRSPPLSLSLSLRHVHHRLTLLCHPLWRQVKAQKKGAPTATLLKQFMHDHDLEIADVLQAASSLVGDG